METSNTLPKFTPIGRIQELASRSDANLIAYTTSGMIGEDAKIRRFNSRAALEAFCKPSSRMFALVKNIVPDANHMTNRNIQRVA